ncbi:MAG: transposase [Firmicutes bacterium]|nr:transposase [Bacillota bacterium]
MEKKYEHARNLTHERIPVGTPNLNAHIEAFHSILEDDCYSRHQFNTYAEAYKQVSCTWSIITSAVAMGV